MQNVFMIILLIILYFIVKNCFILCTWFLISWLTWLKKPGTRCFLMEIHKIFEQPNPNLIIFLLIPIVCLFFLSMFSNVTIHLQKASNYQSKVHHSYFIISQSTQCCTVSWYLWGNTTREVCLFIASFVCFVFDSLGRDYTKYPQNTAVF